MTKLISMDKQYKTRDGRNVRVLCVDRKANLNYPVIALVDTDADDLAIYTAAGTFYRDSEQHRLDLIEVSQWDFPIDTPVLVRDADYEEWRHRYFAGVSPSGTPMAFTNGRSSWTTEAENDVMCWNFCIKADAS